jgi:hypothetical protein
MKILVTGDRNWSDKAAIEAALREYGATEVVEGEARGADSLARDVAESLGWKVYKFPADWDSYGKAAGVLRNSRMIEEKPDMVLAFHDSLKESRGTRDCVKRALARGYKVVLVSHKDGDVVSTILDKQFLTR